MFQFGFSIDNEYEKWYRAIEEVFCLKVKRANGICADVRGERRTTVAVACESKDKAALLREVHSCLVDMFATVAKFDYLNAAIRLPIDRHSYNLVLHTLVAFDRETERELIENNILLGDGMSIDGIFHFRLRELKSRWDEIAALATANAAYLADEDTLNELLRFLLGAVNPKIMRLDIRQQDNRYNISAHLPEKEFEYNIIGTEPLLLYLIDIAPLELRLNGHFTDKRLYDRLVRIFDAKREDNCEAGTKR